MVRSSYQAIREEEEEGGEGAGQRRRGESESTGSREALFCFELLVNGITLLPKRGKNNKEITTRCSLPAIGFRILNYPLQTIHLLSTRHEIKLRTRIDGLKGVASELEAGKWDYNGSVEAHLATLWDSEGRLEFNKGKSCLLRMDPLKLFSSFQKQPIYVMLLDILDLNRPPIMCGSTAVKMDACVGKLFEKKKKKKKKLTSLQTETNTEKSSKNDKEEFVSTEELKRNDQSMKYYSASRGNDCLSESEGQEILPLVECESSPPCDVMQRGELPLYDLMGNVIGRVKLQITLGFIGEPYNLHLAGNMVNKQQAREEVAEQKNETVMIDNFGHVKPPNTGSKPSQMEEDMEVSDVSASSNTSLSAELQSDEPAKLDAKVEDHTVGVPSQTQLKSVDKHEESFVLDDTREGSQQNKIEALEQLRQDFTTDPYCTDGLGGQAGEDSSLNQSLESFIELEKSHSVAVEEEQKALGDDKLFADERDCTDVNKESQLAFLKRLTNSEVPDKSELPPHKYNEEEFALIDKLIEKLTFLRSEEYAEWVLLHKKRNAPKSTSPPKQARRLLNKSPSMKTGSLETYRKNNGRWSRACVELSPSSYHCSKTGSKHRASEIWASSLPTNYHRSAQRAITGIFDTMAGPFGSKILKPPKKRKQKRQTSQKKKPPSGPLKVKMTKTAKLRKALTESKLQKEVKMETPIPARKRNDTFARSKTPLKNTKSRFPIVKDDEFVVKKASHNRSAKTSKGKPTRIAKELDHIFVPDPLELQPEFKVEYMQNENHASSVAKEPVEGDFDALERKPLLYANNLPLNVPENDSDSMEKNIQNYEKEQDSEDFIEKIAAEELKNTVALALKDARTEEESEPSEPLPKEEEYEECFESSSASDTSSEESKTSCTDSSDKESEYVGTDVTESECETTMLDEERTPDKDESSRAVPSQERESEISAIVSLPSENEDKVEQSLEEKAKKVKSDSESIDEESVSSLQPSDGMVGDDIESYEGESDSSSSSGDLNANIYKFEDVFGDVESSGGEDNNSVQMEKASEEKAENGASADSSFSKDSLITDSQENYLRQYDNFPAAQEKSCCTVQERDESVSVSDDDEFVSEEASELSEISQGAANDSNVSFDSGSFSEESLSEQI
eukprot:Nk52_evm3s2273 gene=Nk52_evmTU3s2273